MGKQPFSVAVASSLAIVFGVAALVPTVRVAADWGDSKPTWLIVTQGTIYGSGGCSGDGGLATGAFVILGSNNDVLYAMAGSPIGGGFVVTAGVQHDFIGFGGGANCPFLATSFVAGANDGWVVLHSGACGFLDLEVGPPGQTVEFKETYGGGQCISLSVPTKVETRCDRERTAGVGDTSPPSIEITGDTIIIGSPDFCRSVNSLLGLCFENGDCVCNSQNAVIAALVGDLDRDGVPDSSDTDDDCDNLSDDLEVAAGLNPCSWSRFWQADLTGSKLEQGLAA